MTFQPFELLRRLFPVRSWCCHRFEAAFENRHGQGVFVYVRPSDPDHSGTFVLAVRVVAKHDLPAFSSAVARSGYLAPVHLETHVAVRACPWCGKRLQRFYRRGSTRLIDSSIAAPPESEIGRPVAL